MSGKEMLKKRIIPIELYDCGRLIKTKNFMHPRDVGNPAKSSQVYSDQDADELILLNIARDRSFPAQFVQIVSQIAKNCYVPLTVGGSIQTKIQALSLFEAGADKIVVNSQAYENPGLITEIARDLGKQAIIVGIDVKKNSSNVYSCLSDCSRRMENISLINHVQRVIEAGAGELIIQSIDNDGMMNGYDLELLSFLIERSSVPIIIAGGAGNFMDLLKAFQIGASGAACGSLFNFGDNNPLRAKAFLKNYNIPLKLV